MIELKNTKKYEMIADKIERMVLESGMKPGDRLSSVNDLCLLFNVAPATICNSLELLRSRNVITSIPRKGNFVEKLPVPKPETCSDLAEYLEHSNPIGSMFSPRRKTVSIYIDEYRFSFRKQLWDKIFEAFRRQYGNVEINLIDDISRVESADIILYADYSVKADHALIKAVMNSEDLRQRLYKDSDLRSYFPVALESLSGNQLAAMPFAVSQALRLFNRNLLEQHCPEFLDHNQENLIAEIMTKYDYSASGFPAMGTFIHLLPLPLIEEGIPVYDFKTGKIDFSDHRIPPVLKFNRCMVDKLQNKPGGSVKLSVGYIGDKFVKNELMALDTFSSYALPLTRRNHDFRIMVKPSPAAARLKHSVTCIQILGIGRNCRDAGLALDFIRFACGTGGQMILAESKCNIPALRACAETDIFLNDCPENMNESLKELYLEKSLLNFPIFNDALLHNKINDLTLDYYSGRINLAETVKRLKAIKA